MFKFCTGLNRSRVVLATTHFYSPEELFDIMDPHTKYSSVSVEYGPNLFIAVENEQELVFACRMIAQDHASYISEEDYQQHVEDQAESAHTDKFEKSITDSRKSRRLARRLVKTGARACSVPLPDTIPAIRDGASINTHEMSNDSSNESI